MTSPVFLVNRSGARGGPFGPLSPTLLSSEGAVRSQLHRRRPGALWIATGREGVGWMARGLTGAARRRHRGTVLVMESVREDLLTLLMSWFDRVVLLPRSRLPATELATVFDRDDRADFCIGGTIDREVGVAILLRGDLSVVSAPLTDFAPSGDGTVPDFRDFEVADHGRTLRFGAYEAAFDVVLYLHDPEYRRRLRQRRHEATGLGAAIRRLRKQRGLRLQDLGSLEKAVARIERGEVKRPQRATLAAIAGRLGTTPEELAQF